MLAVSKYLASSGVLYLPSALFREGYLPNSFNGSKWVKANLAVPYADFSASGRFYSFASAAIYYAKSWHYCTSEGSSLCMNGINIDIRS